jgi:hypothetical protein
MSAAMAKRLAKLELRRPTEYVVVDIAPKLAALAATLNAHNAGRAFSHWRPPGAPVRPLGDAGRRVLERLRLMPKNAAHGEREAG